MQESKPTAKAESKPGAKHASKLNYHRAGKLKFPLFSDDSTNAASVLEASFDVNK